MSRAINRQTPPHLNRPIALLTPEKVGSTPDIILSGLMTVAAVHLSFNSHAIPKFRRLALETKASLYKSLNSTLHSFSKSIGDRAYCCIMLIFCIDVSAISSPTITLPPLNSESHFGLMELNSLPGHLKWNEQLEKACRWRQLRY
jgi:hypothetical protein